MKVPTEPNALAHYQQGNRLYRLRKFDDAIAEYQAGAMIEPASAFDYNLGQCYRQLGRYTEAIWHYERFLKNGQPDKERQALLTGFLSQMRAELERKAMTQPPTDIPPDASPSVAQPGPAPAPLSTSPADKRDGKRELAVGIGLAGVAVIGIGVGLGLRAQAFEDDAAAICPMNPCARSGEANELIDRGQTNALYSNVAFGIGGAAILGAAVLWITGSQAERKATAIVPQVSRSFGGVAASVRF